MRAMDALAEKLRAKKFGWGEQRQFAERCGITEESLIRWRDGKGNPRLSQVEAIAQELGFTISDLLKSGTKAKPEPSNGAGPAVGRVLRLSRRAEKLAQQLSAAAKEARREMRK